MKKILLIGILMVLLAVLVSAADVIVKAGGVNVQGLTVDTNTLFVDSAGDKVGIGTLTPTEKLEVVGTGAKVKTPELCIGTDCRTVWPSAGTGAGGWTEDATGDKIFTTTTTRKVGIGTTNPAQKLHISGAGNLMLQIESDTAAFIRTVDSGSTLNKKYFDIINDGGNLLFRALNDDTSLKTEVTINNDGAIKVGQAFLSSGGDYVHLANNEYYTGSAWVGTAPGALIQLAGQQIVFYRHDGQGNHVSSLVVDTAGNLLVSGDIKTTTIGDFYDPTLPSTGTNNPLCWAASGLFGTCTSSIKYKEDISQLDLGLSVVERLNPVQFRWKSNGEEDIGFIAEDVEKVNPILVTYNDGRIQGVKYQQLTAVLVSAIKELNKVNKELRSRVEALEKR